MTCDRDRRRPDLAGNRTSQPAQLRRQEVPQPARLRDLPAKRPGPQSLERLQHLRSSRRERVLPKPFVGRASVPASPDFSGNSSNLGLARTLTLTVDRLGEHARQPAQVASAGNMIWRELSFAATGLVKPLQADPRRALHDRQRLRSQPGHERVRRWRRRMSSRTLEVADARWARLAWENSTEELSAVAWGGGVV